MSPGRPRPSGHRPSRAGDRGGTAGRPARPERARLADVSLRSLPTCFRFSSCDRSRRTDAMPSRSPLDAAVLGPLALIGRSSLSGAAYLGGVANLAAASARAAVLPSGEAPPFVPSLLRQAG